MMRIRERAHFESPDVIIDAGPMEEVIYARSYQRVVALVERRLVSAAGRIRPVSPRSRPFQWHRALATFPDLVLWPFRWATAWRYLTWSSEASPLQDRGGGGSGRLGLGRLDPARF